jgi:two-component sensor histidine kinase
VTLARRSSSAADGGVAQSAWLLVGAMIFLTVVLAVLAVGLLYEGQRQRLHTQAANASQLNAEQAQAILDAARFQVQATKRELLLRAEARHWLEHPDELQALLTEIERVNPERSIFGLGAIDPSGRILALSFRPEVTDLDVSDRAYFRALAAGADRVLGTPVVAWDVGERAISYLEWLKNEAGEPVLILGVSIDLGFLERLYRGIAGHDLAASALFRDDGAIMAGTWLVPDLNPLEDDDGWLLERTAVQGWPLVAVAGAPAHAVWRGILLPSALVGGIVLLLGASIVLVTRAWQERRRAHAALLRTEKQQEVLLRELNHRVRNIITITQAIALQTLRGSADLEEFERDFVGRLNALARTSTLLAVGSWRATELRPIVEAALEPHRTGDNVRLSGPEVTLPSETALTLSLALHELATNAAKYGALSVPQGRVEVVWAVEEPAGAGERGLVLSWLERGGPEVFPPDRHGFGGRLIERGIGDQLGGTVEREFLPEGARCRIELSLEPGPDA